MDRECTEGLGKWQKNGGGMVGVYPEGAWGGMKKVYRRERRAEGNVEF